MYVTWQINITNNKTRVVYGHSSSRIWGGAVRRSNRKWPEVTWPEVTRSHVTGRGHVRKCVLRILNRKLRTICPSGTFFTGSDKVTWPEELLSGLTIFSHTSSPRTFFPYFFSRTFFPYFFLPYYFPGFFSRVIFPYYFGVFFSLNFFHIFFFYVTFFSVLFFTRIFLTVLFSRTFSKSRDFWNPTFQNISELFFLVHVVITQFMFLAEYPFKRHP